MFLECGQRGNLGDREMDIRKKLRENIRKISGEHEGKNRKTENGQTRRVASPLFQEFCRLVFIRFHTFSYVFIRVFRDENGN